MNFCSYLQQKDVLLNVLSNVWRRCLRQYEPQEFLLENFVCCHFALSRAHTQTLALSLFGYQPNLFYMLYISRSMCGLSVELYESRILNCLEFYANFVFFPTFLSLVCVAKTLRNNGQKSDLDFYHRMYVCECITVNWILFLFLVKFLFYEWLNCCKKRDSHALEFSYVERICEMYEGNNYFWTMFAVQPKERACDSFNNFSLWCVIVIRFSCYCWFFFFKFCFFISRSTRA